MSSYSLFCFFLIVQSVAPGLNYCMLFNPCLECSIINFLMFPHHWFPMALLVPTSQCPANTMYFVAACEVNIGSPIQQWLQLNCSAGVGHPWWGVIQGSQHFAPPAVHVRRARQHPACTAVYGKASLEAMEPPKVAFSNTTWTSLCSIYVKNLREVAILLSLKRARDCYHRVMGACWSINAEAVLEALMKTKWKAGIYSLSRQHWSFLPVFSYNDFILVQMREIFLQSFLLLDAGAGKQQMFLTSAWQLV